MKMREMAWSCWFGRAKKAWKRERLTQQYLPSQATFLRRSIVPPPSFESNGSPAHNYKWRKNRYAREGKLLLASAAEKLNYLPIRRTATPDTQPEPMLTNCYRRFHDNEMHNSFLWAIVEISDAKNFLSQISPNFASSHSGRIEI